MLVSCEDTAEVDRLTSEVTSLEKQTTTLKTELERQTTALKTELDVVKRDLDICDSRESLINGEFTLKRKQYKSFRINAENAIGKVRIGGKFDSGNVVRVFVANFQNYQFFRSKVGYKAFHAYKDERKSGILDLLLDKGDYYLVIWFDEPCALFNCGVTKINAEFFYEGLFG